MTSSFKRITISRWRQFESVDIELNNQITVLTGQNGTGKTTLLNILGRHFGWNINMISTPFMSRGKQQRFWSDVLRARAEVIADNNNSSINIGKIEYSNSGSCALLTPKFVSAQYQIQYHGQQNVVGLFIPSHRPSITYQQVGHIPTDPKTVQQHYQEFQQLLFQTYGSTSVKNPGVILKQSLVSLALFGYGNQVVAPNNEYRRLFESFQVVLGKILPKNIGFQRLEVRMPDVVLITETGQFSLDSMSGGVNDLFGLAWQIHMYGVDKEACTVIIDEPENHLHPSMQRTLLPSLSRAFPNLLWLLIVHLSSLQCVTQGSSVLCTLTEIWWNQLKSKKQIYQELLTKYCGRF